MPGPRWQAVLGNTTPVACVALPPARPLVASKSLVPLAVTGATRWADLPDVPTMVELGYKDFVADTFQAFLAPARTPPDIVALLAHSSVEILRDPKIAAQLLADGLAVVASTPDAFAKRIAVEIPQWRDVITRGEHPAGLTRVRITAIHERAVPVRSAMRNAAFDFSEMTTSVVAVVTDAVRAGRRWSGYAFNSTGRYACGAAMRERFIPRLLSASPDELLGADGLLDPARCAARMALREKPGGDAERCGADRHDRGGDVGRGRQGAGPAALARAGGALRRRRRRAVACRSTWAAAGTSLTTTWQRCGDEVRRHLDAGYTALKIKTGGVALDDDCRRLDAVLAILGDASRLAVDANAALPPERAMAYADRLAPYGLRWFEEPCAPQDYAGFARLARRYAPPLATGENLFCLQDVENLLALRRLPRGPRRAAGRPAAEPTASPPTPP